MVAQGLPDADGLLRGALQQARPRHQRRSDTGGAHVHPHVVDLRHEETSWVKDKGAEGPGASY